MDTLRLMLMSLLIGATVSTSAAYTDTGFTINQQIVFQQPASANPTPQIVYVTPAPTQRPSGNSGSSSSGTIHTGTSITRELYRGSQGDDVRMLQRLLRDLGYNAAVDGYFGTQTRNAVIQFQKNNGLKADGIAGARTIRKLVSSNAVGANTETKPRTTLSYGMRGQDVIDLQIRLASLGYYADVISGNYLTNTRNAIRWFQYNNNLFVDGIAGPATLSRVYSPSAIGAGAGHPTASPGPTSGAVAFTRNLYRGLSGADVTYMQQLLGNLGYFSGGPTGYFGSETEWAVRTFQTYNNLYSDGIAGQATFSRLLSSGAVPYPGTTPKPSATPTSAPGGPGEKCAHCGQIILKGDEKRHNTKYTTCALHMECVGGDHATKMGCGHYGCEASDGKNHTKLSCGHYACDGKKHTTLACGHYECDTSIAHELLPCNTHYKCNVASGDWKNHEKSGCGTHFQCDGTPSSDHTKLACGVHYWCIVGSDAKHTFYFGCGVHWACESGNHRRCTHCNWYECRSGVPACSNPAGHDWQWD